MKIEKKFIFGQYFTKEHIVERVIELLGEYKKYEKEISIFEPSSGTGNFVRALEKKGFSNIFQCEIDPCLSESPSDFFEIPLNKKFDLIVGNPPFTKYNVKESYYYSEKYKQKNVPPEEYLTRNLLKKEKIQIENAFLLKSIKHLKDKNSSIGFVLPISFFIANKNKEIKKKIRDKFKTIVIYQNDKKWFEEPIPCCFALFTNIDEYKEKIILLYEDGENVKEIIDLSKILEEELIPRSYLYKKNNQQEGTSLIRYLSEKRVKYNKDYSRNNVSGANILQKNKIPVNKNSEDYCLAVVRVGNSSVGKCGLVNKKEDILNDMFYVFDFNEEYKGDNKIKEEICHLINKNQEHFKNSTVRVGSKSIKKKDIFEFKIPEL